MTKVYVELRFDQSLHGERFFSLFDTLLHPFPDQETHFRRVSIPYKFIWQLGCEHFEATHNTSHFGFNFKMYQTYSFIFFVTFICFAVSANAAPEVRLSTHREITVESDSANGADLDYSRRSQKARTVNRELEPVPVPVVMEAPDICTSGPPDVVVKVARKKFKIHIAHYHSVYLLWKCPRRFVHYSIHVVYKFEIRTTFAAVLVRLQEIEDTQQEMMECIPSGVRDSCPEESEKCAMAAIQSCSPDGAEIVAEEAPANAEEVFA